MKTNWKNRFDVKRLRAYFSAEGGEGGDGGGGAPITPDLGGGETPPAPPSLNWGEIVPADLKEEPWMKDILSSENPTERFFKDMKGLQSKLGQRVDTVPKADSPKEEWDKFYNALGRPETADAYETPATQWPDELKEIGQFVDSTQGNGNDAYIKVLKEVAHDLGIPKEKFAEAYNKLNTGFVSANKDFFEQAVKAKQEMEIDYAQKMTQKFGADAPKVEAVATKILAMVDDPDAKKAAASMSNEEVVRLALVLNDIQKKYISEDVLNGGDDTTAKGMDREGIRAEARKLMADPIYTNALHPDHPALVAKVKALYGRL